MEVTTVKHVRNGYENTIMLLDLEYDGANKYLKHKDHSDRQFWVPWCLSEDDFLKKGVVITSDKTLIACLWQDGDVLYCSRDSWVKPNKKNRLPGTWKIGHDLELVIKEDGNIEGNEDHD